MYICAPHTCKSQRSQKRALEPRTGVMDGYKLPVMDARNQITVFCKTSKCSYLRSLLSSLQ